MNNKQAKKSLPIIILKSILLGLIIWPISGMVVNWLPTTRVVTNLSQPGGGGACGYTLYDKNGNGYKALRLQLHQNASSTPFYNIVTSGYVGSAPLYNVDPESLGPQTMPCYDFPSKIDPVIAQNGIAVYPVILSAKNSKVNWLRAGESYSLVATAKIGEHFPSTPEWIPVTPLAHNEIIEVKFSLYASNFNFSPTNQETRKIPLGPNIPAEQTWSIAPIDRASGDQSLMTTIEGDNFFEEIDFNLEIRNFLGIDSKLLSIIISTGSVVAFLLTQTKTFADLLQVYKEKNEPQAKKHKK